MKLPVLYLVDSIVKNIGGAYTSLFTQNIVSSFCSCFEKVLMFARAKKNGTFTQPQRLGIRIHTLAYFCDSRLNLLSWIEINGVHIPPILQHAFTSLCIICPIVILKFFMKAPASRRGQNSIAVSTSIRTRNICCFFNVVLFLNIQLNLSTKVKVYLLFVCDCTFLHDTISTLGAQVFRKKVFLETTFPAVFEIQSGREKLSSFCLVGKNWNKKAPTKIQKKKERKTHTCTHTHLKNERKKKSKLKRETNVTSTSFRWKNRREPPCSNYAKRGPTYFRLKSFTPWTYESSRSIRHGP